MLVNAAPVPLFFTVEQGQFRPFGIDTTGKDIAQSQAIRNILASDPTAKNAVKTAAKVEKAAAGPKGPLAPGAPAPAAPGATPVPVAASKDASVPVVEFSDGESIEGRWVKQANVVPEFQVSPMDGSQPSPFSSQGQQNQAAAVQPPIRHAGYYANSQPDPSVASPPAPQAQDAQYPPAYKTLQQKLVMRQIPADAQMPGFTPFAQAGGVRMGSRQGQVAEYRPY